MTAILTDATARLSIELSRQEVFELIEALNQMNGNFATILRKKRGGWKDAKEELRVRIASNKRIIADLEAFAAENGWEDPADEDNEDYID